MHEDLQVSPSFKSQTSQLVRELPKIQLFEYLGGHLRPETAAELGDIRDAAAWTRIAKEAVEDLAADGVIYAELRFVLDRPDHDVLHAVLAGLQQGEQNSQCVARLLLGLSGEHASQVAELVVDHAGVVGCSIEDESAMSAVDFLRANFVPFTVRCGAVDIATAVRAGADRLTQAIEIYEDFHVDVEGIHPGELSAHVRDREIPMEMSLSSVAGAELVDEVGDHPLPLLQQLGFTCILGTEHRTAQRTLSSEMTLLVEGFDYGLEELFELTLNAVERCFLPKAQRQELLHNQIVPAYQKFADLEESASSSAADELADDDEDEGELNISGLE
ncbi:hypothetical protein QVA66_06130 [Staphylococcus chromogenes]|nr:hypothetical protein [Staphylococcus chromogenes]